MSRITIPNDLLDELLSVSPALSKTEAVVMAIKEAIQNKRKERIKSLAGKIEFIEGAEDLRHKDSRLGS